MIKKHLIFILALLVLLAACQPVPAATATPAPLTGERASVVGGSALLIEALENGTKQALVPINPGTGQPAAGYAGIEVGTDVTTAFSPDREQMAILSSGAANCANYCLHRVDLRAWKEILPPVEVSPSLYISASEVVFDASASRVAFALNAQDGQKTEVVVADLKTGRLTRAPLDMLVFNLHFMPSGSVAVYGSRKQADQSLVLRVALLGKDSLSLDWQQDLNGLAYTTEPPNPEIDPTQGRYLFPGAAFAPDGAKLYLVAADADKLFSVDFERRSVTSVAIQPPQSLLDRLMALTAGVAQAKMLNGTMKTALISADGKRLYVVGQTNTAVKLDNGDYQTNTTPLGLQVIDPASGALLAKLDTNATSLSIAPDGKSAFLYGWLDTGGSVSQARTELLDLSTLKVSRTLDGEIHATRLLNGQAAWLSTELVNSYTTRLSIFKAGDAAHPLSQWEAKDTAFAYWVEVP